MISSLNSTIPQEMRFFEGNQTTASLVERVLSNNEGIIMVFNETLMSLTSDIMSEGGSELQYEDVENFISSLDGISAKLVGEFNIITPEMWNSEDEEINQEYATYQIIMELVEVVLSTDLGTKKFLIDSSSDEYLDYLN